MAAAANHVCSISFVACSVAHQILTVYEYSEMYCDKKSKWLRDISTYPASLSNALKMQLVQNVLASLNDPVF